MRDGSPSQLSPRAREANRIVQGDAPYEYYRGPPVDAQQDLVRRAAERARRDNENEEFFSQAPDGGASKSESEESLPRPLFEKQPAPPGYQGGIRGVLGRGERYTRLDPPQPRNATVAELKQAIADLEENLAQSRQYENDAALVQEMELQLDDLKSRLLGGGGLRP
jgi:hypothetical protein